MFLLLFAFSPAFAAYGDHDGPYGESDGIRATDARIQGWATTVVNARRPDGVNFGLAEDVLGEPGGTFGSFSLGDGGSITLGFSEPIADGQGADFAVWENSFISREPGNQGLLFAELLFVEVSTDGETFIRFPSVNLIPASPPLGGFGCIDPTYVHNVGGKHPNGNDDRDEGTPFDLDDLRSHDRVIEGTVDLADIRYVRLVDVVGDGSTVDSYGNPMWDPYPTPFGTGGADPDAVGILNQRREDNAPPDRPALTEPEPEDETVTDSLSPTLRTDGTEGITVFSDLDELEYEYHQSTQWQISTDPGFQADRIWDSRSFAALETLELPGVLLEPDTIYYWRLRFYDSHSVPSEWSDALSFTTTSDVDDDGIPDSQELNPADPADLAVDLDSGAYPGPDVDQISDQFKVLHTAVGAGQMAIRSASTVIIKEFASIVPSEHPSAGKKGEPDAFFLGLVKFTLQVGAAGDTATVTVYFSEPAPRGYAWYKYDNNKWEVFSGAVFSSDRRSIEVTLTDGGDGDIDGLENRLIGDPSGLGYVSTPSAATSTASEGGMAGGVGGCFIGTCF